MGGRPEVALREGMVCVYEPTGLPPPAGWEGGRGEERKEKERNLRDQRHCRFCLFLSANMITFNRTSYPKQTICFIKLFLLDITDVPQAPIISCLTQVLVFIRGDLLM